MEAKVEQRLQLGVHAEAGGRVVVRVADCLDDRAVDPGLERGGVGLGPISAAVPDSLKAEIEDVKAGIVAGRIAIATSLT